VKLQRYYRKLKFGSFAVDYDTQHQHTEGISTYVKTRLSGDQDHQEDVVDPQDSHSHVVHSELLPQEQQALIVSPVIQMSDDEASIASENLNSSQTTQREIQPQVKLPQNNNDNNDNKDKTKKTKIKTITATTAATTPKAT
jgi:hypothetical protein